MPTWICDLLRLYPISTSSLRLNPTCWTWEEPTSKSKQTNGIQYYWTPPSFNESFKGVVPGCRLVWLCGPQTVMKRQMCSRLQSEPAVISLSLVIISRSVGWEIQSALHEWCQRKDSWTKHKGLPSAHLKDQSTQKETGTEVIVPYASIGDCPLTGSRSGTKQQTDIIQLRHMLYESHLIHASFCRCNRLMSCGVTNGYLLYMLDNCDNA